MKFHSDPVDEHGEVPLADDGQFEELVDHWRRRESPPRARAEDGNVCYVVSVVDDRDAIVAAARIREIEGLVEAQGDRVVGSETYVLSKPDPRTLIRSGVAERIGRAARDAGADLLVIDAELTPSQTRNLEDATTLPICDREAVILNVFERHATTRRARAQVQIAHLEYLRPRIRGIGLNMDQQAGGVMGSRGPGETASELFARRLDDRLVDLRRRLAQLEHADAARRSHRDDCARVVLVGYTNAGKTSLMNALTSADLSVRDRPFETLDTTARCLSRHGADVLLSDTVGFIRDLPERLFASFSSTLAEVTEASLLCVVLDVADPEVERHLAITREILERLGASEVRRLIVFNQVDRLTSAPDPEWLSRICRGDAHVVLSSRDADAVERLRDTVLETVRERLTVRQVFVPYERRDVMKSIYARCRVLETIAVPRGMQLRIEGEPRVVDAIARMNREGK